MIKRWFLLVLFGALFLTGGAQVASAAVSTGQFVIVERENKPGGNVQLPTGKLPDKETIIVQQKQPKQSNKIGQPGQSNSAKKMPSGFLPQTGEAMGLLALILGCILAGVTFAAWHRQRRLDAHENKQAK